MSGLYIHIPYCHSKCAYCDFYSTPDVSTVPRLVDAIVKEACLRRNELAAVNINTIYIGGGTPSSLGLECLTDLIERIGGVVDFSQIVEFTVEVNPEDVTYELLRAIKKVGVNRVSMGVQSLVDDELGVVGRRHSAAEAIEAGRLIASEFDNFNLDLIFGLPGQSLETLDYSLDRLIELGAPHLSAYLLSYEKGTKLYAMMMAGKVDEATDELCESMYSHVDRRLTQAGYTHYEISNYARSGMESRHNSAYWNSVPYTGLGPSAHSFDGEVRRYNPRVIKLYIESLSRGKTCYVEEPETLENKFNDYLITRLRTAGGIDINDLKKRTFGHLFEKISHEISRLERQNKLKVANGRIVIPHDYWLTSDAILRELIL